LEENQNFKNQSENTSLTVMDIIFIFLKYKKKILISTAFVCVISIILYFFVFDLIYTSTSSIKSAGSSSSLLGGLDAGGLMDIGGLDELGMGGIKSVRELAGYEEILNSRKCLEALITNFKLMERDKYEYMEDAVKTFRENKLKIRTERLAGIMYISVEDKNPVLAKEMVEYLIDELDKINIELSVQAAKNNREFIERRYYQAKDDLTKAEDTLKSFQMIYGVAPDLQIKAAAQSAFALEGELKAEEVKLDVLKKILSPDQIEVKTQESKISSLKEKISSIQNSTDLSEFLRLGNSPQIAMSFLRLEREVEIQTKILTFLLPLYENAKITEKRETPTIMILDKPYVAERKTKPKRLTMVVGLTFGFFLIFVLIFVSYESVIKSKYSSKGKI
jgi:capsule polysaccharide export protein KpsE/RkpR